MYASDSQAGYNPSVEGRERFFTDKKSLYRFGGLSLSGDLERSLGDASALGRKYRWLEAADAYERALRSVEEGDFFKRGEGGHAVRARINHIFTLVSDLAQYFEFKQI